MAFYKINYGCGCGDNEEYLEFNSENEANDYAYEKAIEDYESYEGLHGIRGMAEIADEDFGLDLYELDYNTGDYVAIEAAYFDERESQISYSAEEISEEEYREYVEGME